MDRHSLSRIAVVGTSCAGKTTFSRSLSRALSAPHIELDELYWGPNWTPVPPEQFRSRVREATSGSSWIIDGNYSVVRDLVWGDATTLVWLNLPFRVVYPRAVWRTLRRVITRETLFGNNRESLAVADPDWIPWWVLRTFWRRRREYPALFEQPRYSHLQVLEFTQRSQAQRFLESCAV